MSNRAVFTLSVLAGVVWLILVITLYNSAGCSTVEPC